MASAGLRQCGKYRRVDGTSEIIVKPLEGIERPALMTVLPQSATSKTVVLDLGANVECDSTYAGAICRDGVGDGGGTPGYRNPRVALLNIGEEETKGLDNIRDAAAIIKNNDLYQLYRLS